MWTIFTVVTYLLGVALADDACPAKQNEPWSYGGDNGPENWGQTFKDCDGSCQSPIVINPSKAVYDSSYQNQLQTFGYDTPLSAVLENNGHAVYVRPNDGTSRGITVNGVVYKFVQSHFHFGKTNGIGSEHVIINPKTMSNRPYSMELHLVHQNEAGKLAVVGIMFKETGNDNEYLSPIVDNLKSIRYEGNKFNIDGVELENLFPKCIDPVFYSYDGSLTTPPCSEGVKWFVMNGGTPVSASQMETFRGVYETSEDEEETCLMAGNYRPTQPLNGRKVVAYSGNCINNK